MATYEMTIIFKADAGVLGGDVVASVLFTALDVTLSTDPEAYEGITLEGWDFNGEVDA
jgi:hypothetical protein